MTTFYFGDGVNLISGTLDFAALACWYSIRAVAASDKSGAIPGVPATRLPTPTDKIVFLGPYRASAAVNTYLLLSSIANVPTSWPGDVDFETSAYVPTRNLNVDCGIWAGTITDKSYYSTLVLSGGTFGNIVGAATIGSILLSSAVTVNGTISAINIQISGGTINGPISTTQSFICGGGTIAGNISFLAGNAYITGGVFTGSFSRSSRSVNPTVSAGAFNPVVTIPATRSGASWTFDKSYIPWNPGFGLGDTGNTSIFNPTITLSGISGGLSRGRIVNAAA
jgi:hypothetical protein